MLNEREKTHGNFRNNAFHAQRIKRVVHEACQPEGSATLSVVQIEALDFIASKIGRILSGQAKFPDHWADISGYAMLVVRDLNGNNS